MKRLPLFLVEGKQYKASANLLSTQIDILVHGPVRGHCRQLSYEEASVLRECISCHTNLFNIIAVTVPIGAVRTSLVIQGDRVLLSQLHEVQEVD